MNPYKQIIRDFIYKTPSRYLLVKNTVQMSGGLFLQISIRLVYFLFLARLLQPEEYGKFIAAQAFVSVFLPFANWGSGNILIKFVSRKRDNFAVYWGSALTTSLLFAVINIILISLSGNLFFLPAQVVQIVLPLAIGDLVGASLVNLSGQAFQAFEMLSATASISVLLSLGRLIMLFVFMTLIEEKTVELWVLLYMLSGLLAGILGVIWVNKKLGKGKICLMGMQGNWLEGFYFSLALSSQGVYNDIDKTILNKFANSSITGAYGASYRVLDAAFIPIRSIIYATYPRFFQHGEKSLRQSSKYAFRLMPVTIIVSLIVWLGLHFLLPYLLFFLGPSYSLMMEILPWLAPILLFRSMHYLLANALTGAGYQGLRSIIHAMIAVANLGLNFWLIPIYGWMGAVWSSLLSDGGFVIFLLTTLFILQKKHEN